MIEFSPRYGADKRLCGFTVKNHGRTDVCAAVSLLTLNTVNSVEALTDEPFTCDYKEAGGFLAFAFAQPPAGAAAQVLLDALMLGIDSVQAQYPGEIRVEKDAQKTPNKPKKG